MLWRNHLSISFAAKNSSLVTVTSIKYSTSPHISWAALQLDWSHTTTYMLYCNVLDNNRPHTRKWSCKIILPSDVVAVLVCVSTCCDIQTSEIT
jgi:hypothetical protein